MTTVQIAIRLPAEQMAGIDAAVPEFHESRSQLVRRAVELYLYRLACERDADRYESLPMTDDEMAFSDDPENWKLTPAW